MKRWKRVRILIVFVIGIIVVLLVCPLRINREYLAKEYQVGNPEYVKEHTVKVHGVFRWNILTESEFKGKVIVSDHPASEVMENCAVRLQFFRGRGSEYYYDAEQKSQPGWPLGRIYQSGFMKDMCIILAENQQGEFVSAPVKGSVWDSGDGYFVVTGNSSYETAMKRLQKYEIID